MQNGYPIAAAEREHRWWNSARIRAYAGTLLFVVQAFGVVVAALKAWQAHRQPGGLDFVTFWAASRLARAGVPLEAYSWHAIIQTAQQVMPNMVQLGPWFYPPNFLLLVRPLALLPCPVAYVVFALVTSVVFVALVRKALPGAGIMVWILAFPGLWLNIGQGQNACLTASLAMAGLLLLERWPVLAGVCIGLLSIKPHLAILFPVALACAGMWTAFVAAAVTALALTVLSVSVFGISIVPAFLHGLSEANGYVATGTLPWNQMASLFATLRVWHVPVAPAYFAQAVGAIAALLAVIWVWRRSNDLTVRATVLVAGTFLISPYIYNYDTVWLGVAIALLTKKASRDGWLRGERGILILAWFYPQAGNLSESFLHIGFGSLVFASLIFIAVRRACLEKGTHTTASFAPGRSLPEVMRLGPQDL